MFTVHPPKSNLVIAEIGGKITRDEMSAGLDALTAQVNDIARANMLCVYDDIDMPEIGALTEELKRLPQLFAMISHLDKVAVVSDQKWVRDMAELEGMVIPGIRLRSFPQAARAEAEQWLGTDDGDGDGAAGGGTTGDGMKDSENYPV